MFGVSIFAIAFIIIAGLSLYNKLLRCQERIEQKRATIQCLWSAVKPGLEWVFQKISRYAQTFTFIYIYIHIFTCTIQRLQGYKPLTTWWFVMTRHQAMLPLPGFDVGRRNTSCEQQNFPNMSSHHRCPLSQCVNLQLGVCVCVLIKVCEICCLMFAWLCAFASFFSNLARQRWKKDMSFMRLPTSRVNSEF